MANYSTLKAAIDQYITANGNNEITGTVLNNVLDAMVNSLGANYQFAGVATPSTNPGTPDQNVFYLAMEGGTYTNFNGTVLPSGISMLMWNGTWTSETVMYGDGGVFDISVYKSSGGTLAKYADLAAALDGGNNIPVGVRKGGMSVKFVQSSDNKYVQYRLMSDSFNTTEDNWQGVDDVPTAGSDNLAKSGGIVLDNLNKGIIPDVTVIDNFTQNGTTGYMSADNNSNLGISCVVAGRSYMPYFDGSPRFQIYRIAFFSDYNQSYLSFISGTNNQKGGFTVPSNAKTVRIGIIGQKFTSLKIYDISFGEDYAIKLIKDNLEDVVNALGASRLSIRKNYTINGTTGYFAQETGTDTAYGDVIGGKSYIIAFDNTKNENNYRIAFYKNNNFESSELTPSYIEGTNSKSGQFTAPVDAKSVALAVNGKAINTNAYIIEYDSLMNYVFSQLSETVSDVNSIKTTIGDGDVVYNSYMADRTINGTTGYGAAEEGTYLYTFVVKGNKTYKLSINGKDILPKDYWLFRYAIYSTSSYYGDDFVDGTNHFEGTIQTPSSQDVYYVAVAIQRQNGAVDMKMCLSDAQSNNTIFGQLSTLNKDVGNLLNPFTQTNNVLWLGTSIPEGSSYPYNACVANKLNCINKSVGSSSLGFDNTHPSQVNERSGRCLTATVAELEALYRQDVVNGVITEAILEGWKNGSYERSVIPYIDGTNDTQVSMIVIDHGFNDRRRIVDQLNDAENIDWSSTDRDTFTGAFRYLLDKIQKVNPFIKIVIAGYFTNTVEKLINAQTMVLHNNIDGSAICEMQQMVSEHYNMSIMKTWEHSQIADYYVAGTTTYIEDFNAEYGTNWPKLLLADKNNQVISGANGNIPAFQLYCPDGTHPHTDATGNSNKRLDAIFAKLIQRMI